MKSFTVNNKEYTTDAETLECLNSVSESPEAFAAVMHLGLHTGRITEK